MKGFSFVAAVVLAANLTHSQVVFCPPGAEWHYLFNTNNLSTMPKFENEKVYYAGDSIIGLDTVKILKHTRFLIAFNYTVTPITLIRQKGDTIWMRNANTLHQWQILYNFATPVGQSWKTSYSAPNPTTMEIVVANVTYTTINNFSLKCLVVYPLGLPSYTSQIVERLGADSFLFYFAGGDTDGDLFDSRLCYHDNAFGLLQFSNHACDYSFQVGLQKLDHANTITIFPNPFIDHLQVSAGDTDDGRCLLSITNVHGKQVKLFVVDLRENVRVNLDDLPPGMYFLTVKDDLRSWTTKIVKQ